MSAFMTSKEHIDAILTTALSYRDVAWTAKDSTQQFGYRHKTLDRDNVDAVGEMLSEEMYKSVSYRYDSKEDLPGPISEWYTLPYKYQRGVELTFGQLAKAIHCYRYQSCEHPEWDASEAYSFCDSLMDDILRMLPGYEDAPWGIGPEMIGEHHGQKYLLDRVR